MRSIDSILSEITIQTGITCAYRPSDDESERADGALWVENGKTFFPFCAHGRKFICEIDGCQPQNRNFAFIVKKLLEAEAFPKKLSRAESLICALQSEEPARALEDYRKEYAVPDGECFCLCLRTEKKIAEATDFLKQIADRPGDHVLSLPDGNIAYFRFLSPDGESPYEHACFLAQSLSEEIGIRPSIGVGERVKDFCEIYRSCRQACAALRFFKESDGRGQIRTYREYLLVDILKKLPEDERMKILHNAFGDEIAETMADSTLTETAEEFFLNGLNVCETARKLYVHRNTLAYRLDKIERETGLDIRRFSDAVAFRVLTILYRLQKEGEEL